MWWLGFQGTLHERAEIECRVEKTVSNILQMSFLLQAWSYLLPYTTDPSMVMGSISLGIFSCGLVKDWRHSASSDFFWGRCNLPSCDSNGGQLWFSCWKNRSRFPSLVWQEMYNLEKGKQSFLADDNCCLVLDATFHAGSLNTKIVPFNWVIQWLALLHQAFNYERLILCHSNLLHLPHSCQCIRMTHDLFGI